MHRAGYRVELERIHGLAQRELLVYKRRVVLELETCISDSGTFPRRIAFSFAAMLAFYVGQARADGYYGNVNGEEYRILDDERVIEAVSAACKLTPERYAHEIMTREDFWGEDLTRYDGFEACVAGDLDRILSRSVRAAIDALN